jgi:hypothetical protein
LQVEAAKRVVKLPKEFKWTTVRMNNTSLWEEMGYLMPDSPVIRFSSQAKVHANCYSIVGFLKQPCWLWRLVAVREDSDGIVTLKSACLPGVDTFIVEADHISITMKDATVAQIMLVLQKTGS